MWSPDAIQQHTWAALAPHLYPNFGSCTTSPTFSSIFFSFPGVGIDIALNDGDTHLNRRVGQDVLFTLLDYCLYMVCGFLGDQRRAMQSLSTRGSIGITKLRLDVYSTQWEHETWTAAGIAREVACNNTHSCACTFVSFRFLRMFINTMDTNQ
jgi:hypothetical protein